MAATSVLDLTPYLDAHLAWSSPLARLLYEVSLVWILQEIKNFLFGKLDIRLCLYPWKSLTSSPVNQGSQGTSVQYWFCLTSSLCHTIMIEYMQECDEIPDCLWYISRLKRVASDSDWKSSSLENIHLHALHKVYLTKTAQTASKYCFQLRPFKNSRRYAS